MSRESRSASSLARETSGAHPFGSRVSENSRKVAIASQLSIDSTTEWTRQPVVFRTLVGVRRLHFPFATKVPLMPAVQSFERALEILFGWYGLATRRQLQATNVSPGSQQTRGCYYRELTPMVGIGEEHDKAQGRQGISERYIALSRRPIIHNLIPKAV